MTNSNRETKAKELLLRWIIEESISDKSAPEIEEKLRSHLFDILLAATTLSIFCAYNLYKLISKMLDGTGHYALNIVLCCPIPRSLTGFKGGKSHVSGPALGEVNPT
nr:hypothetical protein HAGR004_11920 [Bdellovibrio sp. HAGR004]